MKTPPGVGFPRNTPAPANYFDWKAQNHVFTDMAAARYRSVAITGDGSPEQLVGYGVTSKPVLRSGRQPPDRSYLFRTRKTAPARRSSIISYGLWQRRFLGDPAAHHQPIMLDGTQYSVIGVMPRDFVFRDHERDFWIPIALHSRRPQSTRGSHFLTVVARLKPDATLDRARQEMAAIAKRLEQQYPQR